MMIPLRRAFIVQQHGTLKYPEGTACADVLIVGEEGGTSAKTVFTGFGLAFVFQFLMQGLRLWKEVPSQALGWFRGAELSLEASPMLLGVGYIIGTRVSCIMLAGAVLSYPRVRAGDSLLRRRLERAAVPGHETDPGHDDRRNPPGVPAVHRRRGGRDGRHHQPVPGDSADRQLAGGRLARPAQQCHGRRCRAPHRSRSADEFVVLGTLALIVVIWAALPLGTAFSAVSLAGAVLIVLFGFLFVTVSSRLTGEIGSSSNPISGMTVATLLLTCLIFLALGWTSSEERLIALTVAAVVCVASSNGGTTSQDLKTGFLVGATPRAQQWAIVVGAISSALVIGGILMLLNDASTVYSRKDLPQPSRPPDASQLTQTAQAPGDNATYRVWYVSQAVGQEHGIPRGKYLVNEPGPRLLPGRPRHHRPADAARRRLGGPQVRRPQTELMAMITDGILTQRLPWALVLLGVFVALVLELVRVPSLPFAVGVYLPFSTSAPVFVGGLVRWLADRWSGKSPAEQSEAEAEMTPGVLLSTGYIAGGAIGGVLIAFLYFSDRIPQAAGNGGRTIGLGPIQPARRPVVRRPDARPPGRRPRLAAEVGVSWPVGGRS